ncbi:MAG TPA: hypothetical protein P5107_05990 [Thermotogota bacterium]|nr:hypothetical protein [Thermotogota bacterium]HRW34584.1 hypothetical protein [Thermotogota bacterium]
MKRRFLILLTIVLMIFLLSSCTFIESNLEYLDSTEDIVNTVYTASIVGIVLFLWGRKF